MGRSASFTAAAIAAVICVLIAHAPYPFYLPCSAQLPPTNTTSGNATMMQDNENIEARVRANEYIPLSSSAIRYTPVSFETLHVIVLDGTEATVAVGGFFDPAADSGTNFDVIEQGGGDGMLHGVQIFRDRVWRHCEFPPAQEATSTIALHTAFVANGSDIITFGGLIATGTEGEFVPTGLMRRLSISIENPAQFRCEWEEIQSINTPTARFAHAFTNVGENKFVLHGGCASPNLAGASSARGSIPCNEGSVLRDAYLFDVATMTWTLITANTLPRLSYHLLAEVSPIMQGGRIDAVLLFGGIHNGDVDYPNVTMLEFNIDDGSQARVIPGRLLSSSLTMFNRGAIEPTTNATRKFNVYAIPRSASEFAMGFRIISLTGTVEPRVMDNAFDFSWSSRADLVREEFPVLAPQPLSIEASLYGGLSVVERQDGLFLAGALIHTVSGAEEPLWRLTSTADQKLLYTPVAQFTQPQPRVSASILKFNEAFQLLSGGLSSSSPGSAWMLYKKDGDNDATRLNGSNPEIQLLPLMDHESFRRSAHCSIALSDTMGLIAGGTSQRIARMVPGDVYVHRDFVSVRVESAAPNANYSHLQVHGAKCFNINGTVIALGGHYRAADFPESERPASGAPASVHFWTRERGWTPCNKEWESFGYAAGTTMEFDNGTAVVVFSGKDRDSSDTNLNADIRVYDCGASWQNCTCDQLRRRIISDTPDQQTNRRVNDSVIDYDSWPAPRVSACFGKIGKRRMFMATGHESGVLRWTSYALEVSRNGSNFLWYEFGGSDLDRLDRNTSLERRPVVTRIDAENFGSACTTFDGSVVAAGGGNGAELFQRLVVFNPSCNLGFGIPNGTDFSEEPCETCDRFHYRGSFEGNACEMCPAGTMRPKGDNGFERAQCDQCVEGFCHRGTCTVLNEAATCSCPPLFSGTQCQDFDKSEIAVVVIIPLIVLLVTVVVLYSLLAGRRQRELDVLTNTLEEFNAVWQIHPSELEYVDEDGRPLSEGKAARSPADIAKIKQQSVLGEGAFGFVVRKKWKVLDQMVAVKYLQDCHVEWDVHLDAFISEVTSMRTLKHRNIVFFYGASVDRSLENGVFIVMEFVANGSLRQLVATNPSYITPMKRLQFMHDAAAGMNYLHTLRPRRVHRDLKTDNLLITSNDVVKVTDFTTATRILKAAPAASSRGLLKGTWKAKKKKKGTPLLVGRDSDSEDSEDEDYEFLDEHGDYTARYAAPETLALGKHVRAADVYSFGIVLWEVLALELPYSEYQSDFEFESARKNDVIYNNYRPALPHPGAHKSSLQRISASTYSHADQGYIALMQMCWSHKEYGRPKFKTVLHILDAVIGKMQQQ